MKKYNHKKIEAKWQKEWVKNSKNKIDKDDATIPKFYLLDMFPYPSGDGLHMGHTETYTANDIYSRYKKSKGFNVMHPTGFDAFGLPAENYAIKTGVHPKETTKQNTENFERQLNSLGIDYDFSESVNTSHPDYYKWTQWLFARFFENELVYRKKTKVNWCKSCQTVLANEQVDVGACERCKTEVAMKEVPSWFFKITDFADDLIDGLKNLDWPEHTKKNQINWIGKSEGADIEFEINRFDEKIKVFTTRPDTLFGATYIVLSPEHKYVGELKEQITNWYEVEIYISEAANKSEIERMVDVRDKTGVKLEGVTAINPANKEEIPVFIADYVLVHYGTGAIMAVPAHDERDYEFAKKFNLEVREVISGGDISKESYVGEGSLLNSDDFNGIDSVEAKKKITDFVGGKMATTYRLRDWSMSRQRYWGAPIPIVYDPDKKAHVVPDEHLPWTLPEDVDFVPKGESPLAQSKELKERTEKIFGKGWIPEFDTMDTFVDSAWYFLRYPDPHNEKEFCDKKRLKHWLPVDLYVGGSEHTYLHLMYARFFTRAMHRIGLINFNEPFLKLRHQGMVLDQKGVKMSKSKGNIVSPDDVVERFGADAVRLYMMFAAPLADDVLWDENGIVGTYRFLERVVGMQSHIREGNERTEREINKLIKKVSEDIEAQKFNTAISAMMIFVNVISEEKTISKKEFALFVQVLAPFAPHIAEELWEECATSDLPAARDTAQAGVVQSVHEQSWPEYDESKIKDESVTIAIQINGKVRGEIKVDVDASQDDVEEPAKKEISKWLDGVEIKKTIYVQNRLINFVVA
jgi:leucyl-tRNA synthetase